MQKDDDIGKIMYNITLLKATMILSLRKMGIDIPTEPKRELHLPPCITR